MYIRLQCQLLINIEKSIKRIEGLKMIQKRFYTRGTLTSTRIPRLAFIPILYTDWMRSLKLERVNYLICIEGKGDGKDIHCSAQNSEIFVVLLQNIF